MLASEIKTSRKDKERDTSIAKPLLEGSPDYKLLEIAASLTERIIEMARRIS